MVDGIPYHYIRYICSGGKSGAVVAMACVRGFSSKEMIASASLGYYCETAAACFEISHWAKNAQHCGQLLSKVGIALFQVVTH